MRGVATDEACILYVVASGIFLSILYSLGNNLHAYYGFYCVSHGEPYCASATIQIQNVLCAVEGCVFTSLAVKKLGTVSVYLIEGEGGYLNSDTAEDILNISVAIQGIAFLAQHYVCIISIDVDYESFEALYLTKPVE